MKFKHKALSIIIAVALLLSSIPLISFATAVNEVYVVYDGNIAYEVVLNQNGTVVLENDLADKADVTFQWQINAKTNEGNYVWADILDETAPTLEVDYSLIKSALDSNDNVEIRVKATFEEKTYVSQNVTVKLNREQVVASAPTTYTLEEKTYNEGLLSSGIKTYVTITINYEYPDGLLCYQPYIAQTAIGTDYEDTVTFPKIVGYEPYVNDVLTYSYYIDIKDIQESFTLEVVYKPIPVNYTVHYMLQNIYNDIYAEDISVAGPETRMGMTGSYTPNEAIIAEMAATHTLDGFELAYNEPLIIAADGSTSLILEYDRNYYLIFFELEDDAYGTDPIYARYGTPFNVNEPHRPGYTFGGWLDENGNPATPNIVQAKNETYTPIWSNSETYYTALYWKENANDDNYSFWGSCTMYAVSGTYINGTDSLGANLTAAGVDSDEFKHFTFDHADQDVFVNGDGSTIVNIYYSRNVYTFTFKKSSSVCHLNGSSITCGYEEHKHTISCYSFTGGTVSTTASSVSTPTLEKRGVLNVYVKTTTGCFGSSERDYYVGFENKYYHIDNYNSNTFSVKFNCAKTEHTHTNACYSGGYAHTHTANCSKVSSSIENTVLVITAKYQADIIDYWQAGPNGGVMSQDGQVEYVGYRWYREDDGNTFFMVMNTMPGYDLTITGSSSSGTTRKWYYYIEVLEGEDLTGKTTKVSNGVTYKLYHTCTHNGSFSFTYEEEYFNIYGFTRRDSSCPSFSNNQAFFYYRRNKNNVEYHNAAGGMLDDQIQQRYYEQSLKGLDINPPYPSTLEKNAYVFDGWYTTEQCFPGTEADFNGIMPPEKIIFYAHYVPTSHTVRLYTDSTMTTLIPNNTYEVKDGDTTRIVNFKSTILVQHNKNISENIPPDLKNADGAVLLGLFYLDVQGVKQGFDPRMRITNDMDVFADWDYDYNASYTIHFVTMIGGTPVSIAPDVKGTGRVGRTKTIHCATEEMFYDEFKADDSKAYFPETAVHVITMKLQSTAQDATINDYTFIYVSAKSMAYTVNYVTDKGVELAKAQVKAGNRIVVTETFIPFNGYVPDAYQKQLYLSSDPTLNVITFIYTEDKDHAYYVVEYYQQDTEGDDYTLIRQNSYLGDLNKAYNEKVLDEKLSFTGFTYNSTASKIPTSKLTSSGLVFKLYYDRVICDYKVNYYETDTTTVLATQKSGKARYQQNIVEYPITISGYTPKTGSGSVIASLTATDNVINLYYNENMPNIKYALVAPTSRTDRTLIIHETYNFEGNAISMISENVRAKTGTPIGSQATAAAGYEFKGWYTDATCTTPVTASWVTDGKLVPQKDTTTGLHTETTYYALFDYGMTKLTINKSGIKESESTVYRVVGKTSTGADVDVELIIHGNASKTVVIPVGTYDIIENGDWSWRYNVTKLEDKALDLDASKNVFNFSATKTNSKWITSDDSKTNNFTGSEGK